MKKFVITIARGFGSGGKDIGHRVAERLGIPCYGEEINQMASEKSGISEAIFAQSDEKLNKKAIVKALSSMPKIDKVLKPQDKNFASEDNVYAIRAEIIKALAENESCVIIGKAADFILRDYENVFSIYIDADREYCIDSVIELNGALSRKEANRLIERTDKYRSDFYKYYTGREWSNCVNYHMFLNSERLTREGCVEIICKIAEARFAD